MKPFTERPVPEPAEIKLLWCGECGGWWWSDRGHACPADQGGGEGIALALIGLVVIYALAYLAGAIRFGWPLP